ncbi:transglycosylase domain-containing protein, partial [Escherichia coli]|uniref:transglycosylase domain-containing protein n=1 Tax=Escherichia coli TaxID=562 RepID=UPI0039DF8736
LTTGEKKQGGSTITMQLARNVFLSSERSFGRKFKEIFLARKIERELSKEEILELYLNRIFLGNRAYGVGAAAQVYFGKDVGAL